MPILARDTDLYPEGFLDRPEVERAEVSAWWALYTLSRREKELMRRLLAMEIPFYAPLIARQHRSPSGRPRTSYVPLFSGYVFVFGGDEHRRQALTSNCVSRWLPVPDSGQLTRDLRQIHRLIECGAPLSPEARLERGNPVRVRSGPFQGLEGSIIKRLDQVRLLVSVRFLQQGASLLIEDYQLERLDEGPKTGTDASKTGSRSCFLGRVCATNGSY